MLDPQIIPQKWGGNLWTHSVYIGVGEVLRIKP